MLLLLLLAVTVHQCLNGVTSHQLPDNYPLCKQDDPNINECISKAAITVIPLLREGIPDLGVASLDPLKLTSIDIGQGQGPISLNLKFSNVSLTGLSDTILPRTEINLKSYSMRFHGDVQRLTLDADYEMSGRVLLLPVTGKGRCRLVATNLKAVLDFKGQGLMKKNKNYLDIKDSSLDIHNVDTLEVRFDNLFNGDKTLGDSINTLLNENWKDMWNLLKPALDQAFGAIFQQYTKRIFEKVPFNDIFLE